LEKRESIKKAYLVGICGIGMSALAGMLKESGWYVEGSDKAFLPPASDLLNQLKIPLKKGYSKENVPENFDCYIIGNSVSSSNEEAKYIIETNKYFTSMPEALNRFFLRGKRVILVTGTHGKTTLSSSIGWMLKEMGFSAGFFVGGILKNTFRSYSLGEEFYVVEGDEYDTAFFDKKPKFFHFSPEILIINSLEFDHVDIYRDVEQIKETFLELINRNPHSKILCSSEWDHLKDVIKRSGREVIWYGRGGESRYKPLEFKNGVFLFDTPQGKIVLKNKYLIGMHNASNLSGLLACADVLGLDLKKVVSVMERFEGVRRRQEFVGEVRGIKIYDDFAHHPTAVAETIKAFRITYPENRIVCIFEPRTNSSRRKVFENEYISSLGLADIVFLLPVYGSSNLNKYEVLSEDFIVTSLKMNGKTAEILNGYNDIFKIRSYLVEGDVVVFMSSGDLNGMPNSLLKALKDENF